MIGQEATKIVRVWREARIILSMIFRATDDRIISASLANVMNSWEQRQTSWITMNSDTVYVIHHHAVSTANYIMKDMTSKEQLRCWISYVFLAEDMMVIDI